MSIRSTVLGPHGRVVAHLLLALIILPLGWPNLARDARVRGFATEPTQPSPGLCDQSLAVPPAECAALVAIYTATGGSTWINATNWLSLSSPAAPCDWHGVVCEGGHVAALELNANRLSGPFPQTLADLPFLTRLALANNRLQGIVPPGICALANRGGGVDLAYNALDTRRADTRACLDRLDPDWAATQTVAPRKLLPIAFELNAIQLGWAPIAYSDEGFYEISYATATDGPYTAHGRTTDRRASSYRLDALAPGTTYFVRVRSITPAHGAQPDELRSDEAQTIVVTSATQKTLLIVYFPADNDLAPYVPMVKGRLRFGSQFNPNVQVVMLSDGSGADDTEVTTFAGGEVTPTDAVFARWGTRELDTADADVLAWFLRYAREQFPADRTIVSLMGHGVALAPEIAWPETDGGRATATAPAGKGPIPPLPKGAEATPGDITNRGFLSTVGLGRALAQATDNGANPFDLLFLDQCFQGNLDTLYELRGAAHNFIASPNYAWLAAPYAQYLPLLAPAETVQQIGMSMIARYERNLNDHNPNAIFGVRRVDLDAIATATSDLGVALLQAVRGGARNPIASAVSAAQYVDTTQCGRQNLTLGPPDELIGLGSLATNLRRSFPAGDRYGVSAAAQSVLDALGSVYKRSRTGVPYIAPGEVWNYDDSITVLAPLPPNSPPAVVWRTSIYTETVPFAATWTPSPTLAISVTASFAYVRDGSWDEFLAEWYAAPLAPTVGEWCHYIPPALVTAGDVEPLALSAAQTADDTVQLLWTPSTQEDAVAYHILAKGPFDIAWVTRAIIPPGQTTAGLVGLDPNAGYQFQVVAQDAAGAVLAQTNTLTLTLGGGQIYLPLVQQ